MNHPRVFLDADVLFAGAAGPTEFGASHIVLRMGQYTLLDCLTCDYAYVEAERNLQKKVPGAVSAFRTLVRESVLVVPDTTAVELWTAVATSLTPRMCLSSPPRSPKGANGFSPSMYGITGHRWT